MTRLMSQTETRRPAVAAGAIVWRGDEVLLIRRAKPPRQGEWSLPGGHVEWGESPAEAAIREVVEETGCQAEIMELCDVVQYLDDARHIVLIDYTARWLSGDPAAADDAHESRFVPFADIAGLKLWDETERVITRSRNLLMPPDANAGRP